MLGHLRCPLLDLGHGYSDPMIKYLIDAMQVAAAILPWEIARLIIEGTP